MSARSRNSIVNTKLSKLKKCSTIISVSKTRRSAANLQTDDGKIASVFRSFMDNSFMELPLITIITKNDLQTQINLRKPKEDFIAEPDAYNFACYNKPYIYCYSKTDNDGPFRLHYGNGAEDIFLPLLTCIICQFKNLVILQLEHCSLQDKDLDVISALLLENTQIKVLSLDGNPHLEQNFYKVLMPGTLTYLSLRYCRISMDGITNLAEALKESELTSINLACNYLDDECLARLAIPLRFNRIISSINLADNWFTDHGLAAFLIALKKFELQFTEILERRKVNMAYLQERQAMVRDLLHSGDTNNPRSSSSVYKARASKISKNTSSRSSVTYDLTALSSYSSAMKLAQDRIAVTIKKDDNPLMVDCYAENKSVYCRGNFAIGNLNVSCNNLTAVGLNAIIDVLKYQHELVTECKGLMKVIISDDLLAKYPQEACALVELLKIHEKTMKLKTSFERDKSHPSALVRSN